jgi:type IV secretory pathway component VirB8
VGSKEEQERTWKGKSDLMVIALIVMSALMPILTIAAFVVGYNVNADRKILRIKRKKKEEKTEDEKMLERIDSARVY